MEYMLFDFIVHSHSYIQIVLKKIENFATLSKRFQHFQKPLFRNSFKQSTIVLEVKKLYILYPKNLLRSKSFYALLFPKIHNNQTRFYFCFCMNEIT